MADSLQAEEIEELGAALRALESELRATLEGSVEAAKPVALDQAAVGRVSRVDAIQQQQMVTAGRAKQRARLEMVRAALHRLQANEYGDCAGCGEGVGYARLKARPEAPLCVRCQGARERP